MKIIWHYVKIPLLLLERNAVPISAGTLVWILFPHFFTVEANGSISSTGHPIMIAFRLLLTLASAFIAWRLHRW